MATMIIEGERTRAASGKTYEVRNPATGELMDEGPAGGKAIGVCGAIVPWNFPLTLAANKVAPAIAAGNTVVLKPASTTPLSTLACIEALIEGGLPEGVINVVIGQATGEAIVEHPLIRKIALTGSTPTGKRVMAKAAEHLKKVTLELGGSDPCIVLDDADLEGAARARRSRPGSRTLSTEATKWSTGAAGKRGPSTRRAGSSSRRSSRTFPTARGCGPRRCSARPCRCGGSRTSTRRSSLPTTPPLG